MNCAVIMGRLTADPELRTTQNGISVTSFTVAVNRAYKQDGQQEADFINVVAWRQTAEFVERYFRKGQMIAIQGRIQTRTYDDRDGNRRYVTEIVADQVRFTSSLKESGQAHGDQRRAEQPFGDSQDTGYQYGSSQLPANDFDDLSTDDDDLPF